MKALHEFWINLSHDTITVVKIGHLLQIKYGNRRRPLVGVEIDLCAPAMNVDYADVPTCNIGVLTQSGEILWSDDVKRRQALPTQRHLINSRRNYSTGGALLLQALPCPTEHTHP